MLIRLILATALSAMASTVVVPGIDTNMDGSSNNGFPFNNTAFGRTSQRFQQIYAASEFAGLIEITGIDFRPDGGLNPSGHAFSSTIDSIQINMSTSNKSVDGLSDTFADNVGADDTVVYAKGSLSLSSADTGPAGGAKDFDIHIQFTTPFLYDPLKGNLLLDIRDFSPTTTTQFDDSEILGDSISRVFADDVTNTSGTADSVGLVTRFDFNEATVPENETGAAV